MSPSFTRRHGRLYRYYVAQSLIKARGDTEEPIGRVAAGEIEAAVLAQLRKMLVAPEVVQGVWNIARENDQSLD